MAHLGMNRHLSIYHGKGEKKADTDGMTDEKTEEEEEEEARRNAMNLLTQQQNSTHIFSDIDAQLYEENKSRLQKHIYLMKETYAAKHSQQYSSCENLSR